MVSTPHTGAEITAADRRGEMTPGQRLGIERSLKAAYSNGIIVAGGFAVNVHKSTTDIPTYVACGDLSSK